tara:strand:- start:103 stop:690 length:588 start_codon:yes stop_codon:yes gene_type:complete
MKIFNIYSTQGIEIKDPGLERVINLDEKLVLRTLGRLKDRFDKTKINLIERIANLVAVSAHRGKKHKIQTGHASGKYTKNMKIVLEMLRIIEEKTQENPIQVLVKAIENSAPRDEVTMIEYGGARYPNAVDMSPMRRLNVVLRNIVHGAYDKSFNKKTKIPEALANEIILASESNMESFAMSKKNESEKQADSAR